MRNTIQQKSSELILASSSPRRKSLLNYLNIKYFQVEPNIIENIPPDLNNPVDAAKSIAHSKAISITQNFKSKYVISADTLVFLNKKIFGKPKSSSEAINMLMELRGQKHSVVTAIALKSPKTQEIYIDHTVTEVTMRNYSDEEMNKFVESGSSFDKAGAYAIQDNDFNPVEIINGCYTNVLGLPICTMIELFKRHGFIWDSRIATESKLADDICSIAESWDMEI